MKKSANLRHPVVQQEAVSPGERHCLANVWDAVYPAQLAHLDLAAFDAFVDALVQPRHYVVLADEEAAAEDPLVGWLASFDRTGLSSVT